MHEAPVPTSLREFVPHAAHSLVLHECGQELRRVVARHLTGNLGDGRRHPRRDARRLDSECGKSVGLHEKSPRTTLAPAFPAPVIALVIRVAASRNGSSTRWTYFSVVRLVV